MRGMRTPYRTSVHLSNAFFSETILTFGTKFWGKAETVDAHAWSE